MSEITLKTFNPVVFDDPEFCNKRKISNGSYCRYMGDYFGSPSKCELFDKYIERNEDTWIHKKCKECKEHYAKNKTQ